MTEFEDYLKQNYGLKDGDEVPDDVYEKASAEFLQSRNTVPSIAPATSAFDLDKALPEPPQEEATPQAQQTPPDESLGGLLPEQVNVLTAYWTAGKDFNDLIQNTGLKDREKTQRAEEWQYVEKAEWEPVLNQVGLSLPEAKFAVERAGRNTEAKSLAEALGAVPAGNKGQTEVSEDAMKEIKQLQDVRAGLVSAIETAPTEEAKRKIEVQVASLDGRISAKLGTDKVSPVDLKSQIENTRKRMTAVTDAGGGTVNYMGIPYGPDEFGVLEQSLATDERNAFLQASENPAELRVSRARAAIGKDGKLIKDPKVIDENYMNLRRDLQPGEWFQDTDNVVKVYAGPEDEDRGSFSERWTPNALKPAIKGAGVVAGDIVDTIVPAVKKASDLGADFVDKATYLPRKTTEYLPTVWLARRGLDYLSAIGRKAEEDEKKLAGK
jgi:hypothetical protein